MERRAQLHSARDLVSVVQADHLVLGFSKVEGPFGTFATIPIVTDIVDEAIFDGLKALGVGDTDARHFMYALANSCHRFVTLDSDFLDRKCELEEKWPVLRVVRPSELAEELRSHGAG
jgi:hypothetical protein